MVALDLHLKSGSYSPGCDPCCETKICIFCKTLNLRKYPCYKVAIIVPPPFAGLSILVFCRLLLVS